MTAVAAERAFAADAQTLGQWTALRKWATPDAIMFLPQPSNAQEFLKPLKDPEKSVEWWPTASFLSCDGTVGANTGGALWPNGRHGYFSTIWAKQADGGWRWTLDYGADVAAARPRPAADGPAIRRASCANQPGELIQTKTKGAKQGAGTSRDRTLGWSWSVWPTGARLFNVQLWTGTRYELVIVDVTAPPKPAAP